jgi:hypothetical protein
VGIFHCAEQLAANKLDATTKTCAKRFDELPWRYPLHRSA